MNSDLTGVNAFNYRLYENELQNTFLTLIYWRFNVNK